jgi:hypothetical protein
VIAQVFVGYADPEKVLALAILVKAGQNVWTHLAFLGGRS